MAEDSNLNYHTPVSNIENINPFMALPLNGHKEDSEETDKENVFYFRADNSSNKSNDKENELPG
jgi:hypothetical protein